MSAVSAVNAPICIEDRTFDEIKVGDSAHIMRTLTQRDIELFAAMSGDMNPAEMDPDYARNVIYHRVVAHGMWGGSLISAAWHAVAGAGHHLSFAGSAFPCADKRRRHHRCHRHGD